jgi:hypothetical protein
MPVVLSKDEQRCLELACQFLGEQLGGTWMLEDGPLLEDDPAYQGVSRPEARITDGVRTAAVEVKALTGDRQFQDYWRSLPSLKRQLRPSCGGYYFLVPWVDLRLPLGRREIKELKCQIEHVALGMAVDESRPIRVSRNGRAKILDHDRAGPIYCSHMEPVFRHLQRELHGSYWLADSDQNEHRFMTEQARADLVRAFSDAVHSSPLPQPGTTVPLHWYEEWELKRVEANGLEDGVWVCATTDAADVGASISEILSRMLEAGIRKFRRRWADFHVIALDKQWPFIEAGDAVHALKEFDDDELADINLVLLVEVDRVTVVRRDCDPQPSTAVHLSRQRRAESTPTQTHR